MFQKDYVKINKLIQKKRMSRSSEADRLILKILTIYVCRVGYLFTNALSRSCDTFIIKSPIRSNSFIMSI